MRISRLLFVVVACALVVAPAALAAPGDLTLVSIGYDGSTSNGRSDHQNVNGDGSVIVFQSYASNLVAGDTNGAADIFARDASTGATERVNVSSSGAQGVGGADEPALSADGRYVVFVTYEGSLTGDGFLPNKVVDLRDRLLGTTERISPIPTTVLGCTVSQPTVSDDGRYVAWSGCDDGSGAPSGTVAQTYVKDRLTGATALVSAAAGGGPGNGASPAAWISGGGRYVAFSSSASDLVPGDTNGVSDVFVRDLVAGSTVRASVAADGSEGNGASYLLLHRTISADGRQVGFYSSANNLVAGDTNSQRDTFVRDVAVGTTERVDLDAAGQQLQAGSFVGDSMSSDGRYVVFEGDMGFVTACFQGSPYEGIRDRVSGTTEEAVSLSAYGSTGPIAFPDVSGDGLHVVYVSNASGEFQVYDNERGPRLPCTPTITSTPEAVTTSTDASFSFTLPTGMPETFACRLDGGVWTLCDAGTPALSDSMHYTGLALGTHTFDVRFFQIGNEAVSDTTSFTWTVQQQASSAGKLTGGGSVPGASGKATFGFELSAAGGNLTWHDGSADLREASVQSFAVSGQTVTVVGTLSDGRRFELVATDGGKSDTASFHVYDGLVAVYGAGGTVQGSIVLHG